MAAKYDELDVLILQCGDFGFWPHTETAYRWDAPGDITDSQGRYALKTDVGFLKNGRVSIYWCDGNHENHDVLDDLEAKHCDVAFIPVMPGVFYAPFGSVLTLLDGTTVMFCGGAESSPRDISARTPGFSWWRQEGIDNSDMARLPDPKEVTVDWIISHTGPRSFNIAGPDVDSQKDQQPSKERLESLFAAYRPKRWWFGHYHTFREGRDNSCHWMLLDQVGNEYGRKWVDTVLLTKGR